VVVDEDFEFLRFLAVALPLGGARELCLEEVARAGFDWAVSLVLSGADGALEVVGSEVVGEGEEVGEEEEGETWPAVAAEVVALTSAGWLSGLASASSAFSLSDSLAVFEHSSEIVWIKVDHKCSDSSFLVSSFYCILKEWKCVFIGLF
jgi:hypothetical protein